MTLHHKQPPHHSTIEESTSPAYGARLAQLARDLPACAACLLPPASACPDCVHHTDRSLIACVRDLSGRMEIKHGRTEMLGFLAVFAISHQGGRRYAGLPLQSPPRKTSSQASPLCAGRLCFASLETVATAGCPKINGLTFLPETGVGLRCVDRRWRHRPRLVGCRRSCCCHDTASRQLATVASSAALAVARVPAPALSLCLYARTPSSWAAVLC